ncbi:hypothetical protein GCM10008957_36790 [Deinococcus ruber]|uniref:Uncharacterized protein n=1 Tax=Deinococcus ruber TaxID=1848197 RepID=A0A918CFY3_9DEIO|nr:hypothetical protein GCM10008957_36790 [Deinococcus ruber]
MPDLFGQHDAQTGIGECALAQSRCNHLYALLRTTARPSANRERLGSRFEQLVFNGSSGSGHLIKLSMTSVSHLLSEDLTDRRKRTSNRMNPSEDQLNQAAANGYGWDWPQKTYALVTQLLAPDLIGAATAPQSAAQSSGTA